MRQLKDDRCAPTLEGLRYSAQVHLSSGLVVMEMDSIRLVNTLATTMSIRSRRTVRFELAGEDYLNEFVWTNAERKLRGIVEDLLRPKG